MMKYYVQQLKDAKTVLHLQHPFSLRGSSTELSTDVAQALRHTGQLD